MGAIICRVKHRCSLLQTKSICYSICAFCPLRINERILFVPAKKALPVEQDMQNDIRPHA